MTDDLITWLLTQLDADERVALRAGADQPTWSYDRETFTVSSGGGWSIAARKADGGPINDVDGEHIARHDPARVLAEVDAKRRILDAIMEQFHPDDILNGAQGTAEPPWLSRVLALPYADRPGYREEWRPEW